MRGNLHDGTTPVSEVSDLVVAAGIAVTSADVALLRAVLARVGDVGVAADAVLMFPRPDWLVSMIGEAMLPEWVRPARKKAA